MGIAENSVRWLMKQVEEHKLAGSVLSLGKTDVEFNERKLLWLLAERGLVSAERRAPGTPVEFSVPSPYREKLDTLRRDDRLLALKRQSREAGLLSDVTLYQILGFDVMHSLDINDYEGADILYDLNIDGLSSVLSQKYDLITNFGTLEHVFNLPMALKNIFDATKIGGRILHWSPTNNWVDHGFYQISPTFYYDYYRYNNFSIKMIQVHELRKELPIDLWSVTDYRPGALDELNHGGFDSGLYNVAILVEKTENSTWNAIPSQRIYQDGIWINNRIA